MELFVVERIEFIPLMTWNALQRGTCDGDLERSARPSVTAG
jgi:hypothetical protein